LQDRLIDIEFSLLSRDDEDDALDFVNDLYAAIEAMFRKVLTGKLPPDISNSKFIECAQKKAMDAGLGGLPRSLQTVKLREIRQTLQGDDKSLGACVIAFLLMLNEDSLQTVSENQPSFISDVTEILNLSIHGNKSLNLKKEEITKLRDSVYKTIKTLLEAEEWDYLQN